MSRTTPEARKAWEARQPRRDCACGCGQKVDTYQARWVFGHHNAGLTPEDDIATAPIKCKAFLEIVQAYNRWAEDYNRTGSDDAYEAGMRELILFDAHPEFCSRCRTYTRQSEVDAA